MSIIIPAKIDADVYNGQDEKVEYTFGSASILITYKDMPEEDIYNMAKALFENNELLVAAYPQCNEWNIENATRGLEGLVEMHPGVIKYLKEKGVMN